jgi:hypothetical protein
MYSVLEQNALFVLLGKQAGWRWCRKCQGLVFGQNPTNGRCPSGGARSEAEWRLQPVAPLAIQSAPPSSQRGQIGAWSRERSRAVTVAAKNGAELARACCSRSPLPLATEGTLLGNAPIEPVVSFDKPLA